ncbi:MAG: glycogen synthase [Oscillospiraceae bacterium]
MTLQTMKRRLNKLAETKALASLPSVLVVAAECTPLAKTGGLGDVVGALPARLRSLGFDTRIMIPCHRVIKEKYADKLTHIDDFYIDLGWRRQYVGVETMKLGRVTVYLIDNEFYFGNRIYEPDNFGGEQYAYFCRAVLEALPRIGFIPGVIHTNDWHTAAIPMLLRTQYQNTDLSGIRTVFTIHNIAYQGMFGTDFLGDLLGIDQRYMTDDYLLHDGCANLMKSACRFADRINTVSPTYAGEILSPEYGEGLEGVLLACRHKLSGILNGIDTKFYNPETDPSLPAHYSARDVSGKAECRRALCGELGLSSDRPIISMVTRMTRQKGFDLILEALDALMQKDIAFVLLGTGDRDYEDFMRAAEGRYPGAVRAILTYDESLSHKIYAASDLFLMPSLFEPCGISQMIAMRYGTLPIVRETGGLKDTVVPYNQFTGNGTGFTFCRYSAHDLLDAVDRALEAYGDPEIFSALVGQAMSKDFGFDASAYEYGCMYLDTL